MTTQFDILDPLTKINSHLILEASAGCGKTFTIENLVVRLLEEGFKLSEIVIVTFTKQGAVDLRTRLRSRLEKASPHFLRQFDEATISTLHAFAFKILQENPLESKGLFKTLKIEGDLLPYLKAFLELERSFLTLAQLQQLLTEYPLKKLSSYINGPLHGFEETQQRFSLYLKTLKEQEEWFTYDDLLIRLENLLKNPVILKSLKDRFKIGIIDEFQDTDQVQWEIFKKLFFHEQARLYLVGDPKQSIYSFRGAEIYTYLSASKTLGEACLRSLSCNWRTDPELIEILNRLFTLTKEPSFLPLPKYQEFLPVPHVSAPPGKKVKPKFNNWEKLSFFYSEKTGAPFYNFIAARIIELHKCGVPYHEMAILVDTNSRAEEVADYLKQYKLPYQLLRDSEEKNNPIEGFLEKIIYACHNLKNDSALFEALRTPFWGWTLKDFSKLNDLNFKEELIWTFMGIKKALEKGDVFFKGKILSSVIEGETTLSTLLKHPEGQIFLNALEKEEISADLSTPKTPPAKNKIQILTLHVSKGLEFEVVFPLGLAMRKKTDKSKPPRNAEEDAELLRLFYVAMTRAKSQIFVPLNFKKRASNYEPSAVELFFSKIVSNLSYGTIKECGFQICEATGTEEISPVKKKKIVFTNAPILPLLPQPLELLSFTKLKSLIKNSSKLSDKHIDYDLNELPPGPLTGVFLHKIFEEISLSYIKNVSTTEEILPAILPFIKNSNWEMWQEKICDQVFKAFNKPIEGLSFLLKEVEEKHSYREVEFFHQDTQGYMKGVIDWLFFHQDGVYIVDWKSNWLEDYSEPTLKKTMQEEGYYLQAEIYKTAAERFLQYFPGYSLKGIYFYFLRGGRAWKAM